MRAISFSIVIFALLGSAYNVDGFTVRSLRPVTSIIRPTLSTMRMSGEEGSAKKKESTWDRITGPKRFKVSEIQHSCFNIDT